MEEVYLRYGVCVVQVGNVSEHLILLPPLPKCCDYRQVWACWKERSKFYFPHLHGAEKGHASLVYQCPSKSFLGVSSPSPRTAPVPH